MLGLVDFFVGSLCRELFIDNSYRCSGRLPGRVLLVPKG